MATFKINEKNFHCPVELTLDTISGKWKGLVLWHLREGAKRNGELKRALVSVTNKMLTQVLRELEDDDLIHRKVYHVVPPKVEYSLTEQGERLRPVLEAMQQWGLKFKETSKIV